MGAIYLTIDAQPRTLTSSTRDQLSADTSSTLPNSKAAALETNDDFVQNMSFKENLHIEKNMNCFPFIYDCFNSLLNT
jgi:hypothetical protein